MEDGRDIESLRDINLDVIVVCVDKTKFIILLSMYCYVLLLMTYIYIIKTNHLPADFNYSLLSKHSFHVHSLQIQFPYILIRYLLANVKNYLMCAWAKRQESLTICIINVDRMVLSLIKLSVKNAGSYVKSFSNVNQNCQE